ncbi:N-(5'-phosphoribosyl)anthranilate isomerase [Rhodobacterales bacterium HKCCE3408]|nr:N-(5'-phosphoribosyl)anthranilate isomerase [Rhodobacterales bacterium HKCCE3408]
MRALRHYCSADLWLAQIFSAKAVASGGVVRRSVSDVERILGRERLELEIRRRGFHLIEAGDQFIVICNRAPVRLVV